MTVPTRGTDVVQAYQLLRLAFVAAPTIAGLDKFARILTNWDNYLSPQVAHLLPIPVRTFMMIVGVVEIIVGLIVAVRPRIGASIVALWLLAIIVNLLLLGRFFDVALRDFGLMLAALALGRLADAMPRRRTVV
ncbi:MAG: hypothetical protein JST54_22400 [Deltaproteobacteria bacterium]|nr:hypothetical protein [Deltaproteobacteria bacterium]